MSFRPTVTVIIPVYNGASHVETAFESVVKQTLEPLEVLFIDDGSTDASGEVLEKIAREYAGPIDVRVITQPNGGQSHSRNQAAAAAHGDFLAFLDQDDLWYPNHLEVLVAPFRERADLGWTYSDFDEVDVQGRLVTRDFLRAGSYHMGRQSVAELIANDLMVLPTASVVRAAAFRDVGGFDTQLSGYEDDDLFIRVFRAGWRAEFINETVSVFRIHPNSSSTRSSFRRSRMVFYRKLSTELPDDPRLNRYYISDLLRPRLLVTTLYEYNSALSRKDYPEARAIIVDAKEMMFDAPVSLRKRFALAVLGRPRFARFMLQLFGRLPRLLRPKIPAVFTLRRWSSH